MKFLSGLVLGLLIPLFLIGHIAGTRVVSMEFDIDESYSHILPKLWNTRALGQTALVIITWAHGCAGLYHAWRWKPWFRPWRTPAMVLAILVPVLALAGFVVGSRDAIGLHVPPDIMPIGESFVLRHAAEVLFGSFSAMLGGMMGIVVVRMLWRQTLP